MDAPLAHEDTPFGNIPLRKERAIFERHYIDLVALEVRWGNPLGPIDQAVAIAVRDAIETNVDGPSLSVIERVEQRELTLELADGHATPGAPEIGHVLRTQDSTIVISLLPQSLGIQLGAYARWSESMKPLLEATMAAVRTLLGAGVVSRAGLRYVNRIHDERCQAPKDWANKISPALVAPYRDWGLQEWVDLTREQIELKFDQDHGATLRHGVLSPTDYLIDVDIYSQRTQGVDVADMVSSFTRMNRTALAVFQQAVPLDYMLSRQEGEETQ